MTDLRAQMRSALSKAHTAKDIDRFLDDYFPEGSVLVTPETLAAAMRALPPIPDEFLLRKTWVESDWTPNARDYAAAILAALTPAVRDLCRMTGRYLAGDSDIEPQDVTAAIDEVHAALTPEPSGVCPECGCGWDTRRHGPGDPLGCFKPALTKAEPWNPDGVQP
jgi:hypothetical protein